MTDGLPGLVSPTVVCDLPKEKLNAEATVMPEGDGYPEEVKPIVP
jgi:hypothetical protein